MDFCGRADVMWGVWKVRWQLCQSCHVSKFFSNIGCGVLVYLERRYFEVAEVTFSFATVHFIGDGWLTTDGAHIFPVAL